MSIVLQQRAVLMALTSTLTHNKVDMTQN